MVSQIAVRELASGFQVAMASDVPRGLKQLQDLLKRADRFRRAAREVVVDGDHHGNLQLLNRLHFVGPLFQLSLFIHDNLVPDLRDLLDSFRVAE
jgi:hypothetical protein